MTLEHSRCVGNCSAIMAIYTKDVLKPGTFRVSEKEAATFTKSDLERMAEQFNAMRADELSIPVPWEHPGDEDPEGRPMTKKEREQHRAKFNAGWVNKLFVEGDVLKAEIDVPLEADAERIEKVGTFVSPAIGSVIAGEGGKKWDRVVKHVALTNKPVQARQGKFEPVLAASLSRDICLSMADAVDSEETPDEGEAVSKQGVDQAGGKSEAQDPQVEEFRQAMLKLGVMLPEKLKVSGDLKVLIAAVANAAQGKGNAMSTDKDTKEVQPQTVQLSREDADRLTKAEANANVLLAQVTGMKRAGYASRVSTAFGEGRCDKATHDKLNELATGFQFSMGEEEGKSELDIRLSMVEANPKGTFWSDAEKVVKLSVQEVTPAKQFQTGGVIDSKRVDEVVNELMGAASD